MKIRFSLSILLLPVIASLVISCSSCFQDDPETRRLRDTYEEAQPIAAKYWSNYFNQCGNSYLGVYTFRDKPSDADNWLFELKEPNIRTFPLDTKLTDADRLNGVEWEAKTSIWSKAYRIKKDGVWQEWIDGNPIVESDALNGRLRKVRGKVEFTLDSTDWKFTKIGCNGESTVKIQPKITPSPRYSPVTATVIIDNAKLLDTQDPNGKVRQILPKGTQLIFAKQEGVWFLVSTETDNGWIHGNDIRLNK